MIEIIPAWDTCIKAIKPKIKYGTENFQAWKENVLAEVKEEITKNKTEINKITTEWPRC